MRKDLSDLRQDYTKTELSETNISNHPIQQFSTWFTEAQNSDVMEPNAMTLATVDSNGKPSARIVLLKGFSEDGFYFYTNYDSSKAKDMELNPYVSGVFLYLPLERQIRISGSVVKVSRKTSEEYFHSRPRGSQIGAWVSPQSTVIKNRQVLEERLVSFEDKFKDEEIIPLPDNWGGYLIIPDVIEFWQGRPDRLHDRIRYSKEEGHWKIERVAP